MVEAYFSNIEQQIVRRLSDAKQRVLVAVAWFTNEILFEEIMKCRQRKVPVSIIIMDDYINRNEFALDFSKYINAGGILYLSKEKKMHNKFCVIDNVLISGSYNWTYYAELLNCENIIVLDDVKIVDRYILEFKRLQDAISSTKMYEPVPLKQISEKDLYNDYNYLCSDLFLKGHKYRDAILTFNKERNIKIEESNIEYDNRGIPLLKKDSTWYVTHHRLTNYSIGKVHSGMPNAGRKYVHAKYSTNIYGDDYWVDIFDTEYVNEVSKYIHKSEGGSLDDTSDVVPIPESIYNPLGKYKFIPVHYIFYKFGKYGNKRLKYGIDGKILMKNNGMPYEFSCFDTLIRYDEQTKKYVEFESKTELCHFIVKSLFCPNEVDDQDDFINGIDKNKQDKR